MINATMVVATIPVTDPERAKEFYGGVLGLTFLWETPVGVRYRCGSVSELSVFKRPPTATEHTLAHFEVDDIDAVVQDLAAKGVEFLDYREGPSPQQSTSPSSAPPAALGSVIPTGTPSASARARSIASKA